MSRSLAIRARTYAITAEQVLAIILIAFVALSILTAMHFNLNSDGAHYALYGHYLDLSYFDHPPLVGWLEAIGFFALGENDAGALFVPFTACFCMITGLYYLTNKIYRDTAGWTGLTAAILLLFSFIFQAFPFDLLPQTIFIIFAGAATWFLIDIIRDASWKSWIGLGISLGLAGLADYTLAPLCLGIAGFLLIHQRKTLKTIKPYVSAIIALLMLTPILIWNAQHDFVSIHYQLRHGLSTVWSYKHFFRSILIQFIAYNPFIVCLTLIATWQACKQSSLEEKLLLYAALPILLLYLYSGGHKTILPHWPALGWFILLPLTSKLVLRYSHNTQFKKLISILATVMVITLITAYTFVFFDVSFNRPINKGLLHDIKGWPEAAEQAHKDALMLQLKTGHPEQLFVNNWHAASRLAWYSHSSVQVADSTTRQFKYWFGKPNAQSEGILLAWPEKYKPPLHSTARGKFAHCQPLNIVTTFNKGHPYNQFYYYHCWHFNTQ